MQNKKTILNKATAGLDLLSTAGPELKKTTFNFLNVFFTGIQRQPLPISFH
jgi:hypothetical protein